MYRLLRDCYSCYKNTEYIAEICKRLDSMIFLSRPGVLLYACAPGRRWGGRLVLWNSLGRPVREGGMVEEVMLLMCSQMAD